MSKENPQTNLSSEQSASRLQGWQSNLDKPLTTFIAFHYVDLQNALKAQVESLADSDDQEEIIHVKRILEILWNYCNTENKIATEADRALLWWCCEDTATYITSYDQEGVFANALPQLRKMQQLIAHESHIPFSREQHRVSLHIRWFRTATRIRMALPADKISGGESRLLSWIQAITIALSKGNPSKTELSKANWAAGGLIEQIKALPIDSSCAMHLHELQQVQRFTQVR